MLRNSLLPISLILALTCPSAMAFKFKELLRSVVPDKHESSDAASGDLKGDMQAFMQKASAANELVTRSSVSLAMGLSSRQQAAEFQLRKKALDDIKDPKERDARMEALQRDAIAIIQQQSAREDVQQHMKAASRAKKEAYAIAFFNFALGLWQAKDLVPLGSRVIANIKQDPWLVLQLAPLWHQSNQITGLLRSTGSVMRLLPELFRSANIAVKMPESADSKPLEVADASLLEDPIEVAAPVVENPAEPVASVPPVAAVPAVEPVPPVPAVAPVAPVEEVPPVEGVESVPSVPASANPYP